jgi:hypothetical protein
VTPRHLHEIRSIPKTPFINVTAQLVSHKEHFKKGVEASRDKDLSKERNKGT